MSRDQKARERLKEKIKAREGSREEKFSEKVQVYSGGPSSSKNVMVTVDASRVLFPIFLSPGLCSAELSQDADFVNSVKTNLALHKIFDYEDVQFDPQFTTGTVEQWSKRCKSAGVLPKVILHLPDPQVVNKESEATFVESTDIAIGQIQEKFDLMNAKLDLLQHEMKAKDIRLDLLEQDNNNMKAEMKAIDSKLDLLQHDYTDIKARVTDLEDENSTIKEDIRKLQISYKSMEKLIKPFVVPLNRRVLLEKFRERIRNKYIDLWNTISQAESNNAPWSSFLKQVQSETTKEEAGLAEFAMRNYADLVEAVHKVDQDNIKYSIKDCPSQEWDQIYNFVFN